MTRFGFGAPGIVLLGSSSSQDDKSLAGFEELAMTVAMESEEDGFELAAERQTPETILIEGSNRQLLQRAIDELPARYREVLLLCEVEEMSYQQIAEILSIPIGTVMSRLARARKAIRESFMSGPEAHNVSKRLVSSPKRTRGVCALCR
jgi:DNA-directed RNA polymerase specialized sigma24 family protein